MRRFLQVASALAAVTIIGGAAQAQFRMRPPSISGIWNPSVGSGAEYEMDSERGKMTMQVAVVGKDTVDGKDGYWLETSFTPPNAPGEMVMKMFYYRETDDLVINHRIMQMSGRPPMEMPDMMMRGGEQSKPITMDIRKDSDDLGSDSVTTPAGTFTCEHYKMKDSSAEFWVKENTGPWGLVKSVSKNGTTMILTRVFSDAKSKITEKPVPFNPMGMGRPQP
jgi:hypothetical protein